MFAPLGGTIEDPATGSANAKASITRTQISNGLFGIVADGSATTGRINGVVRDSVVSGNVQNGITTSNGSAGNVTSPSARW